MEIARRKLACFGRLGSLALAQGKMLGLLEKIVSEGHLSPRRLVQLLLLADAPQVEVHANPLFFGLHLASQRGRDALRKFPQILLTTRFIGNQHPKKEGRVSRPILAKLIADADDVWIQQLSGPLH